MIAAHDIAYVARLVGQRVRDVRCTESRVELRHASDAQFVRHEWRLDTKIDFAEPAALSCGSWRLLRSADDSGWSSHSHRDALGQHLVDAAATLRRTIVGATVIDARLTNFGDLELRFDNGAVLQAVNESFKHEDWELFLGNKPGVHDAIWSNYVLETNGRKVQPEFIQETTA